MKKVCIVIGHTPKGDQGAYSKSLGHSEFNYNFMVAEELSALSDDDIEYSVFVHTTQPYYTRQKIAAETINKTEYDLVLELHFNAAESLNANGVECLHYYASKKGKDACEQISADIHSVYGSKIRGNKGARAILNKQDRGYWFLKLMKAPAVIVEPFFGSNPTESVLFKDTANYAKVLHNSITKII